MRDGDRLVEREELRVVGEVVVLLQAVDQDLDDEVLRLIWTDGYEDAICDDDLFDEED